ncbi:calpastatin [Mycobacterium sp. IS-1742]|uniref:DUF1810 domain-containing protein n=1 Tax=Mycobacterium sp. IS-1742 TaxID=1772285 RepID=UPI00073FB6C9|nr:DUF1810 domain-containing protein [Mycobacterium sp. IS-1742]KUI26648.1 calpastatin [Mycobacterium sp. IS-1742]
MVSPRTGITRIVTENSADPHDLQRFVDAQDPVYDTVIGELRAGRKRSHWIWFIFPQLKGLGRSPTAQYFGIASREEAVAYLEHEVLGPRLRECTRLVLAIEGRSAGEVFGSPDDLKLRSSMTLFARCSDDNADFVAVLDRFYGGEPDPATVSRLS